MNAKLETVLQKIDQSNHQDPNQDIDQGKQVAKEWLYGQRMSERLTQFEPDASELLQIAARGQHIQRWSIPRSDYPEGRVGYKHWRTDLGKFHGEKTAELMLQAGYSEQDAERVKALLQKKGLKQDTEVQTLEDVICLVFLEHYLAPFAEKHSEPKLITIIQKTWSKMSEKGHQAALKISYQPEHLALIQKALA
ncbi:DUF4202 domain-containing protein [Oceanospirillum sp.]|uniref:DUF4202 domain-containing protein n=1 Tax=Oceanospirillum sp. TaxID=2021254 RepID=UPI003A90AB37